MRRKGQKEHQSKEFKFHLNYNKKCLLVELHIRVENKVADYVDNNGTLSVESSPKNE